MTLSPDARRILEFVAASAEPVAASDCFHDIYPPTFDPSVPDDDPDREEWVNLQLGLYRASIDLWKADFVVVVHPANGERPDLVSVTDAGRAALG